MAKTERFTKPPHAAYVSRNNRPLSMMDRHLAALRMRDEEAAMRITTEAEAVDELTNFTLPMETDEYGFPVITKYMVSDSVPDVLDTKGTEKDVEETKKEITSPDSGTPPLPE